MAMRAVKVGMSALLLAGAVTACQSKSDAVIYDNFGIAGYARLQGTVSHSDGTRFGSINLVYSCGAPDPTWFGATAVTNSLGEFDIAVDAPVAGTLPPSGTLACQVAALGRDSVVARARATTTFSQYADARPVTMFTLVEGQSVP